MARLLGAKAGDPIRILKSFYGFTSAPRIFWLHVKGRMEGIGGRAILGDQCVRIFVEIMADGSAETYGVACTHVDDFLMAGSPGDSRWNKTMGEIKKLLRWGSTNARSFRFAGINYRQLADASIECDQEHYTSGITDLDIPLCRLRTGGAKITKKEESALRHKLGELMWVAVSTDPRLSARVGLLLSGVQEGGDMSVAMEVHVLVQEARACTLVLKFLHLDYCRWQEVCFVGFGDASLHNRSKGGSTGGYFTVACHQSVLQGELTPMSPLTWRSWKLERKAVSTNDGEIQAAYHTEDELFRLRLVWGELHATDVRHGFDYPLRVTSALEVVSAILATDSRGGYDAVHKNESPNLGLSCARSAVQAHSLKQKLKDQLLECVWVAGDWNLSDCLTKKQQECRKSMIKFLDLRV